MTIDNEALRNQNTVQMNSVEIKETTEAIQSQQGQYTPDAVKQLLRVFNESLANVSFPGISAQILEKRCEELEQSGQHLAAAKARLIEAEEHYKSHQKEIFEIASEARDYALVFARKQSDLDKELKSISFTGLSKKPRKAKTTKKSERKGSAVNDLTTEAKTEAHDISKQMEAS